MATIKLYLDKRCVKNGPAPIKVAINKHGSTSYISLGVKVLPSQWDSKTEKVKDHPNKSALNSFISSRKTEILNTLMRLSIEGELTNFTPSQIKRRIEEELDPSDDKGKFLPYFKQFASTRNSEGTQRIYLATERRMREYDSKVGSYHFEDITKAWLDGFERYFLKQGNSDSTISIDLRNIRACINDAIDNELVSTYVFRKKKIKVGKSPKRSLSLERLRELWNYPVEPWQERYLDFFKLSFLLVGINLADLVSLVGIEDGRIAYSRKKTSRPYYIKVEPEALEIINKYRGKTHLVNICETFANYKSFMEKLNRGLRSIGPIEYVLNPKYYKGCKKHQYHIKHNSLFPGLTYYWARHTWATLAAELEIPKETISAALGHSSSNVTDVYIKFNYKKVDEANRKVIDFVLQKETTPPDVVSQQSLIPN